MLARMARILGLLRAHPAGLTTQQLLDRVGYDAGLPHASRLRTLNRDLAALARDGWRIDTLPTANTPAVRVLRTVDNRFAVLFCAAERAELARAAACAGPTVADALADDLGRASGPPPFVSTGLDGVGRLAVCQAATADRCILTFAYNGSARLTYPIGVLLRPGGWYLRALDTGDNRVKQFAIDRMRRLRKGAPGTSPPIPDTMAPPVWDALRARVHDPIVVTVQARTAFLPDVLSALATWGHEIVDVDGDPPSDGHPDGPRIRVEVPVTNTEALVVRLVELGTRVRLIAPDDVREALRARLLAFAGQPTMGRP